MTGQLTIMEISTAYTSTELLSVLARARIELEALGLSEAYTVPSHHSLYDAINGFLEQLSNATKLRRPSALPNGAPWPGPGVGGA